jgi:hypothetical protein
MALRVCAECPVAGPVQMTVNSSNSRMRQSNNQKNGPEDQIS